MIQHRSMTKSARSRSVQYYLDLSSTTRKTVVVHHPGNDIKIQSIYLYYTVATSSHAQGEAINIGTPGGDTYFAAITPAVSTAAATVTQITPSQTRLSADYFLTIQRSAHSGTSNTGEVVVIVNYELIDKNTEA